jgi:predicted GNAT family N-acyltransferase
MKGIVVRCVEGQAELNRAFKIRETVFINEQKVSREEEMDEFDETATHVIAYYNDEVAGCARIRFLGNRSKLERIAVLPKFRKRGVGKKIVEFLVDYSKKKCATEAIMNAQIYANDFYVKCGFKPRGEEFMEAGIRHVEMYMKL